MREGKVWGETSLFFMTSTSSSHHITVKKGGRCSKHKHRFKHNLFYVVSGKLQIKIWRGGKNPDITVLRAGESSGVSPGFFHEFKALENTEAIENYQVILVDPDIERENVGGMDG